MLQMLHSAIQDMSTTQTIYEYQNVSAKCKCRSKISLKCKCQWFSLLLRQVS